MSFNIEFIVLTYFISLSVDWIFQTDWQATNKSKWEKGDNKIESLTALISHSFIYSFFTTCIITLIGIITINKSWIVFSILLITHIIIDTRIIVKKIMKFKMLTDNQISDYKNFGFIHIGIDHRLHEIVIIILSLYV